MKNCGECKHWGSMQHDEKTGEYVAPCLANPPVFIFGVDHGCWPVTSMYDRCGWWREIPAERAGSTREPPEGGWPADHRLDDPSCLCPECIPF